jgi:hypothetical protein
MKKLFAFFSVFVFVAVGFSQVPEKLSYQAVIRNADGELIKSSIVGIKISILRGSATGTVTYVETHNLPTNENGLVSLQSGSGTPVTGNFSGIDWSTGIYYLKTQAVPSGGINYTIDGTGQCLSVPYAGYAKNSFWE